MTKVIQKACEHDYKVITQTGKTVLASQTLGWLYRHHIKMHPETYGKRG